MSEASSELHLHPKPVPLCALESMGELEAVHLEQVEEGVSHHVGDAVVRVPQTSLKPGTRRHEKCRFLKKHQRKDKETNWTSFSG